MFDIGWTELLVVGVVALIVVGPRDLPGMFRTLGRFTGKMRGMAREFQRAMESAADEAGVKDMANEMKGMTNPKKMGLDKLNEAADRFDKWEPTKKKAADIGPETSKLSEERAEAARKIHEYSARKTAEKRAAEAEAAATEAQADVPEAPVEADAPKGKDA